MTERWYRVTETTYSAGVNEWGDPIPGGPTRTNLESYAVMRHTPTGVWLETFDGPRFVSRNWNKMFATPTVDEAITSYRMRKARQLRILRSQIARTEDALLYLANTGFYSDCRDWEK